MLRFTNNLISKLCKYNKVNNHGHHFYPSGFKRSMRYGFSQQNISSRQVDIKINEQRWKNLQNNYKALNTSFGLTVPQQISKNYKKPDRIQFNLQALRQCSNQYPEYLFQQLKKQDSKFYQIIDVQLSNLWRADKKEGLQMISFIIIWKIYFKNQQIGQMLLRTIKKMDLNLFQIFELLKTILQQTYKDINVNQSSAQDLTIDQQQVKVFKVNWEDLDVNQQSFKVSNLNQDSGKNQDVKKSTNSVNQGLDQVFKKILVVAQNKIVSRLQLIDPSQYQPLFKIMNLFRLCDVYPAVKSPTKTQQEMTFFQIIQKNLLKNLNQIPPTSLVNMAVHYANNTKQNQDQRIQILQKLQERIIFNMKFFTHEEIIALLYSYMRTSLLSTQFSDKFVKRIRLIYNEMTWENKKKILALSSNFPSHEKALIISEAHSQLLKGKPVTTKLEDGSIKKQYDPKVFIDLDYQLVPEIYLASYQNNLLTHQLAKKMQQIILSNIYNYDREEVVRSVWLFTVIPDINNNLERLHKKLQVIIEGGLQGGQYTIKDLSIIVWSLCNSGSKNQQIYKGQAAFWNNIQFYLQEKLQKLQTNTQISRISNVSSILWAYTFNRPLKFKTVSLITDILFEDLDGNDKSHRNMLSFQLINIITFYYSLPRNSFPKSLIQKMKSICLFNFQIMHREMSSIELMKSLKFLSAEQNTTVQPELTIKTIVWQNIVQTFSLESQLIQYQHIIGIVGLLIDSPLGRSKDKRVIILVDKLLKRKKRLEQLKPVQANNTQ